jgi:hypothetical protein
LDDLILSAKCRYAPLGLGAHGTKGLAPDGAWIIGNNLGPRRAAAAGAPS